MPPLLKPNGSLAYSPEEKSTLLADIFDAKQSAEELIIPQSCHPEAKLTRIAFRSFEIKRLLSDVDPYGGAGPDGIFPSSFKETADILAPKIAVIFRKLVRTGRFSLCWRTANVTPISKVGTATSSPQDHRPISITPILSKVYERLLARRLMEYAEKNNLFPSRQFAYRKGLSTCDAVLTISDKVQIVQ